MTTETITSFSQHLAYMSKGRDDAFLTEQLRKVVAAVMATGKKGSVTVCLEISKQQAEDTVVVIKPKITTNIPTPSRAASFLFALPNGDLVRDDPDQQQLELRQVAKEPPQTTKVLPDRA